MDARVDVEKLDIEEAYDSTMSGFIALTKLCKIAGRVAHTLHRPNNGRSSHDSLGQLGQIHRLDKMLTEWLANEVVS